MQGICTLFYFRGISVNLTISSTLCPEPDVAAVKIELSDALDTKMFIHRW
jgi:hypothetical protein